MKKTIKSMAFLSLFLLMSLQVKGQQNSQNSEAVTVERNIQLDKSSDSEEIKIEVLKALNFMEIGIDSTIKSGHLTVEIYDPNGTKKGNFSVESQIKPGGNKKEMVSGQMQKKISNPIQGNWLVKLIPENVVGQISIFTTQVQEK